MSDHDADNMFEAMGFANHLRDAELDRATLKHLNAWLDKEFPDAERRNVVRTKMIAVYVQDPVYYADLGWWRVFDHAMGQK
jgi:hypothetical protein